MSDIEWIDPHDARFVRVPHRGWMIEMSTIDTGKFNPGDYVRVRRYSGTPAHVRLVKSSPKGPNSDKLRWTFEMLTESGDVPTIEQRYGVPSKHTECDKKGYPLAWSRTPGGRSIHWPRRGETWVYNPECLSGQVIYSDPGDFTVIWESENDDYVEVHRINFMDDFSYEG